MGNSMWFLLGFIVAIAVLAFVLHRRGATQGAGMNAGYNPERAASEVRRHADNGGFGG